MSRLPIRVRLTAVFVVVMGVLLAVFGLFLFERTRSSIDAAIDDALSARRGTLVAAGANAPAGVADAIPPGERQAQLLSVGGRVLASRPAGAAALLRPAEAARAARGTVSLQRAEQTRLLAGPAELHGRRVVAVVAASLADREHAIDGLGGAILVGGPLALLLAAALAYATAAGALSPVETIRRRAQGISRAAPDARLPVPHADDEIRRLALTLNDMLARIAAGAAHERAFVANASHELRTPLAALTAELDLALRHGRTVEELRDAITAAKADGDRLALLAADLLELARADEGTTGDHEPVDVDVLLDEAAVALRPVAPGRRIVVRRSGLTIAADAPALGRAVRNLVENALVHGRGTVVLSAEGGEDAVSIFVEDDGELDPALAGGAAFERFVRGPGTAGRPGAGLGLALVRAVAEAHGGEAALEPRPSGGVRARLTLPASR